MDRYNEITRQIGYNPKEYTFEDLEFWQELDHQASFIYFDDQYIIDPNVREGTHIRNRDFEILFTQKSVEGNFLHFITLYEDKVFFLNYDFKKSFCLDIKTQKLREIPFRSIVGGIKIGKLCFCTYRHEIWLYDLESEQIIWKNSHPEIKERTFSDQWFSRSLYWKNTIIITDMRYSKLMAYDFLSGEKLWEINPKDIDVWKEHRSIGHFYVVDDLLIGHSEIKGEHNLSDYKNKGRRELYAFDLTTKTVKWQKNIVQWLNRYVSSKNAFHYFYFHPKHQEVYYQEIDLSCGEILFDFSIQEQLDQLKLLENLREYIQILDDQPSFMALLYANERLYFSYGSHYLALDAKSRRIEVVYKRDNFKSFGGTPRIIDNLMIMDVDVFKLV